MAGHGDRRTRSGVELGPREVLAHVAEMLPFWMGEIELILDAGADGEPLGFGRLEDDPMRVEIITRDRGFPARSCLAESTSRRDGSPGGFEP